MLHLATRCFVAGLREPQKGFLMRIKKLTTLLLLSLSLSACTMAQSTDKAELIDEVEPEVKNSDNEDENVFDADDEQSQNIGDIPEDPENMDYGAEELIDYNSGNTFLSNYPRYTLETFNYLNIGNNSFEEKGNFICLAASIYSYEKGKVVRPDEFLKLFNYTVGNEEEILDKVCKECRLKYTKKQLSIDKIHDTLAGNGIILVNVPRPSQYSKGSAYIMITDMADNGYCVVYDPDFDNMVNVAISYFDEKYWYSISDLLMAVGNNKTSYYITREEL